MPSSCHRLTETFFHYLGYGLCHQLPERSFAFGGLQWSVCARCSGIYLGFCCALAVLFLAYRGRQRCGGPTLWYWPFMLLALAALGYDGVSSYLGWRETTNVLRLLTGIATGAGLAPLVYSMLVSSLAKNSLEERIFEGGVRPLLLYVSSMVFCAVSVFLGSLWGVFGWVVGFLVALCVVCMFAVVMLVVVGLYHRFEKSVRTWSDVVLPAGISLVLGFMVIIGSAALKAWAIGW